MSTHEPSKDVLEEALKPKNDLSQNHSVDAGLAELVQLARQSFEDKRRKQSLALTRAILKIDPENKDALVIQAWIRDDLEKQLRNVRVRVAEAQRENSLDLYDQAERLLRGILNVDPQSKEATTLLAEVIPAQRAAAEVRPPEEEPDLQRVVPFPAAADIKRRRVALVAVGTFVALSVAFAWFKLGDSYKSPTAQLQKSDVAETKQAPAPAPATGSFELVVVPQTGVQLTVDNSEPRPVPQKIELPPGPHRLVFTSEGYSPETLSETVVAGQYRVLPVIMSLIHIANKEETDPSAGPIASQPVSQPTSSRPSSAPAAATPDRLADGQPKAAESVGVLALSAAVPVNVYLGGKKLGTTPVKLRLPAGLQTLEYRYEDSTQMVTHLIKSGQTITATIVFDVNLQINARPWAQVSIEGPDGRTLGQTPLSNVTVAAGSVLVFKHPSFPEKQRRVTGKDKAIQVVFP